MARLSLSFVALALVSLGCHHSRREAPPVKQPGTLHVATYLEDGVTTAGAGVQVRANGVTATTGADGTATMSLAAGTYTVECLDPYLAGAAVEATVVSNEHGFIAVTLADEGCVRNVDLWVGEADRSVVRADLQGFSLGFRDHGLPVTIAEVVRVELHSATSDAWFEVADLFALVDGALVPTDLATLAARFSAFPGSFLAVVAGRDGAGRRVQAQRELLVGRHAVHGVLHALSSGPGVQTAGVPITGTVLGSAIALHVTTDAAGEFRFDAVPAGQFELSAQVEAAGQFWTAFGVLSVDGNAEVQLTMLAFDDIVQGQPSLTVLQSDVGAASVEARLPSPQATMAGCASDSGLRGVGASATSAGRDVRVVASDTVTVPQGTSRVALRYEVTSAEYPAYVYSQSRFNDVWEVRALAANGATLFTRTQRVNDQLRTPPVWQADGSTGVIFEDLDVTNFTTAGTAQFAVVVASTNIGDGLYPTTVMAALVMQPGLRIQDSRPVDAPAISIPPVGQVNLLQKDYVVDFTRPDDLQLTDYRVEILADDTSVVLHDFGRRPVPAATAIDNGYRLVVPVTFAPGTPSTVSAVPQADCVRYRFTLFGTQGTVEIRDTKSSPSIQALWQLPGNVPRYACRDEGGDDWCVRRTWELVVTNASLFPAVNDVAGEHGRSLGHQAHTIGRAVDVYHFTRLDGGDGPCAPLGTTNSRALRMQVLTAFGSTPAAEGAKAVVREWFKNERAGLAALANHKDVIQVLVAYGIAFAEVREGYYRDLLMTGSTTSTTGFVLDLEIGEWHHPEVVPDVALAHETHNHADVGR